MRSLSPEEEDEFGLQIERESLIATVQGLLELEGFERTRKALYLDFEHSAKAFLLNLRDWLGEDEELLRLGKVMVIGQYPLNKGCKSYTIDNNIAIFRSSGCPYEGLLPDICWAYCTVPSTVWSKEINPLIEVEHYPASDHNDHVCTWTFRRPESQAMIGAQSREVDIDAILAEIPPEEITWRAHHYAGAVWEMIVSSMFDTIGDKVVLEKLVPYMQRNGFSFGLRIKRELGLYGEENDVAELIMESFDRMVQRSGPEIVEENGTLSKTIEVCPYSGSTPQFCRLFEAMASGICSAINPELEFIYDRMMTKGDSMCRWSIRRKEETKELNNAETDEDPLEVVRLRYARGEIDEEQFDRMLSRLRSSNR